MNVQLHQCDPAGIEEQAAHAWLAQHLEALRADTEASSARVLWLHSGEPIGRIDDRLQRALSAHDGPLLLTGGAATIESLLGHTTPPDNARIQVAERAGTRGHAGLRTHPLFEGLHSGVDTWWPLAGEQSSYVVHRLPAWPRDARVIAIERRDATVDAACATAWELPGRSLSIGAHVLFAARDASARNALTRFVLNALRHVARGVPPAGDAWPMPGNATRPDATLPLLATLPATSARPLHLATNAQSSADLPFLAGRRTVASWSEREGVRDVVVQPIRIMTDIVGARTDPDGALASNVHGLARDIVVGGARVVEHVLVPDDAPGIVFSWSLPTGAPPADLMLGFDVPMQLAPPYPHNALGNLSWHVDDQQLVVRTDTGDMAGFVLHGHALDWQISDASDVSGPRVRVRLRMRLAAHAPVLLCAAAARSGTELQDALTMLSRPDALSAAISAHARRRERHLLRIDGTDLDTTAVHVRLERCVAETPELGRCILAPARAHDCSALECTWILLSALAAGDAQTARVGLETLGAMQSVEGGVAAHWTASGYRAPDSADATALYILAAARWHAWTGDAHVLGAHWPRLQAALAFCARHSARSTLPAAWTLAQTEIAIAAEAIDPAIATQLKQPVRLGGGATPWPPFPRVQGMDEILAMAEFAFGTLGAEADAARNRLRLRPSFAELHPWCRIARLRMGDTATDFEFRREEARDTYRIEQVEGALPVTLILEPTTGRRVVSAMIDGAPASLETRVLGSGFVTPVQLVLETARTVELWLDG